MKRAVSLILVGVLAYAFPGISGADEAVEIKVLSNRADLISGGDALVEIMIPSGRDPGDLTVMLGTNNVTSAFAVRAPYGRYMGSGDRARRG